MYLSQPISCALALVLLVALIGGQDDCDKHDAGCTQGCVRALNDKVASSCSDQNGSVDHSKCASGNDASSTVIAHVGWYSIFSAAVMEAGSFCL